ncbi:MFS transporter [Paenibacillus qinlingensis]|uniref:MFS family permease n=1 Tax=Paenibacillus qinlingensis TaxID=1837343 RepID=A0ABU1NV89_9BACL|nr:MFS transporter [Paenibacillus qinlingensis]MDR6551001.1 MFS family permease [Paenibacillus qinlingensis]
MRTVDKLWKKNFILLALSNLFLFVSIEMLLPTLPIFADERGGSGSQIGMMLGIFTFSAVLSRLLISFGVKRLGKRKLLLIGVAISLAGMASHYATDSISTLLVLRVFHGFGFGIATALYVTLVSDVIPTARRGEGMGYFAMGNAVSFSLGPLLGLWLLEHYNYAGLFGVGVIILVITLVMTLLVRKAGIQEKAASESAASIEIHSVEQRKSQPAWTEIIEPKVLVPSILGSFVGFSFGGLLSFVTLFSKEIGITQTGYFFLVVAISEILIRFVSGPLFDRKGPFWVLFPTAILCIIGCVLLYFTDSLAMLLLAGVFSGAGFGAMFPALQAWVINLVQPERRGVASATYYNFLDIGIGFGSILLGVVVSMTSYATMFLLSGILYVLYLIVYFMYLRHQRLRMKGESERR